MLHPAPFDGSYFAGFAEHFAGERDIPAPDYPGYGRSAPPPIAPAVGDYAAALLTAMDDFPGCRERQPHLLGFHTGCLVACEMARQAPQRISKLVLIDVPFFAGNEQRRKYAEAVTDDPATQGFAAAFSYDCSQLAQVANAALVIATGGALRDPSIAAAGALPNATLQDCPAIIRPVFTTAGDRLADLVRAFLHG